METRIVNGHPVPSLEERIANNLKNITNRVTVVETTVNTPITFTQLFNAGLVGPGSNQLAEGDHDHDIGSVDLVFENNLI